MQPIGSFKITKGKFIELDDNGIYIWKEILGASQEAPSKMNKYIKMASTWKGDILLLVESEMRADLSEDFKTSALSIFNEFTNHKNEFDKSLVSNRIKQWKNYEQRIEEKAYLEFFQTLDTSRRGTVTRDDFIAFCGAIKARAEN